MKFLDYFSPMKYLKPLFWKFWYPFLTRRLKESEILFLNYAFIPEKPISLALSEKDKPNQNCIQLYYHVASQVNLTGKEVLEVSCGHGGGASFIFRYLQPEKLVGIDLNREAIQFCREQYLLNELQFKEGNAEKLPFGKDSFDAVLNVEASHCYPNFSQFLLEVYRVLKPGGHLLYADFRFKDEIERWEKALHSSPLNIFQTQDITPHVIRGMEENSDRSLQLIERFLPFFLNRFGRLFAGVKGSYVYNALKNGEAVYRSYVLKKDNVVN